MPDTVAELQTEKLAQGKESGRLYKMRSPMEPEVQLCLMFFKPPDLKASWQERGISSRFATMAATGIVLGYVGVLALLRDYPSASLIFNDVAVALINLLAASCLFYAALCSRGFSRNVSLAWMMLATAQLFYVFGDLLWSYFEIVLQQSAFPTVADLFYLLYYPLFFAGILLLPAAIRTPSDQLKMLLDTGIVMITAVLIFWQLLIAPTIQATTGSDGTALVLAVAYPVMDLVLVFALIELLFRRFGQLSRIPLFLLAVSAFTLILTDVTFMSRSLHGAYSPGTLNVGWMLAYIMAGLAGIYHSNAAKMGQISPYAQGDYSQFTWPFYIPYFCAAGAFVLLIWSRDHPLSISFSSLSWAVGGIMCLVVTRQILTLKENSRLYRGAQQEIAERKQAELEIKRLNEELELRVKERTTQLEAANQELESKIAERKRALDALRDSERRLADIIDFLPDATFVVNREGEVIAWNRAIEKLSGIKAEEILGKGGYEYALPFYGHRRPMLIDLVLHPDNGAEGRYDSFKRQEDGTVVGEAFMPSLGGGSAYVFGSAAVLYDSEGDLWGAIEALRDITERKKAEADLQRAKEKAESATRAKSEFLANMSHEIRTPMNAVIGMTGLLLRTKLDSEQRDYAETLCNSGDALLAIINDILDFSKIEGGRLLLEQQPFHLRTVVEESLDLVAAHAAEKGLELMYQLEDDVPAVIVGDVTRLRQVLVNLLGNAVKFTEKGEVALSVSCRPAQDRLAELSFEVKDTGIGISEKDMSRLFQFFSQVDSSTTRNYGGTGLGLAISRRLVEAMGGRIWAESVQGCGSTFHFTILAEALDDPDSKLPSVKGNVLVTCASPTTRGLLARYLASWGMSPVLAASGQEGLSILDGQSLKGQSAQVALIDVGLPDMEPLELAREIEERYSRTKVVIMTPLGHSAPEARVAGWVTKPIKPLLLRRQLVDLIAEEDAKGRDRVSGTSPSRIEHGSLRILLAEDNPVNQKVAVSMLKTLGITADVAANGLEVLQALARQEYDIVLMDVQMPEMDGLEATRSIRILDGKNGKTWIVAMTAYAQEGDREECLKTGMNDYLSKPIRMQELEAVLKRGSQALGAGES
jgi:PAS domain S-box-containing protein